MYHELRLLAETARRAGAPLPVLVLHDVGWPYGRRDLYYEPDRIPAEFRQPYRRRRHAARPVGAGVHRGPEPMTWPTPTTKGGPRNGVMTALDDFLAEHPEPVRRVVLPIFYGLAIVAEDSVLRARPELAALLDHLEGSDAQRALLELGERIRIDEAIFTQTWLRNLEQEVQRGADRYLELVKSVLLDERNLQHELRVAYVLGLRGDPPDAGALRDPVRALPAPVQPARAGAARRPSRRRRPREPGARRPWAAPSSTGWRRQWAGCVVAGVPGDFVEVGVGGGGGGILLRATLEALEVPDRCIWLADTFSATSPAGETGDSSRPSCRRRCGACPAT